MKSSGSRRVLAGILTIAAVLAVSPGQASGGFDATISRTAHGIPHIVGDSWGDLGFGVGYAFAEDNICVMADTFVTVNAQRSRFFGPNATYRSEANGVVPPNIESDFFYEWINRSGVIEGLVDGTWPNSQPLSKGVTEITEGWVAGYNAYLRDVGGADGISDPACSGAEWVREIEPIDLYRRYYNLIMFASKGALLRYIVGAQPPVPTLVEAPGAADPGLPGDTSEIGMLPSADRLAIGSNAYALGEQATDTGRGMLLGNPHFPWRGPERFYQFHLTWPGRVNVQGGALFGSPLVHIGTTNHVAWSHTVSVPYRFTPYQLALVPGDPTAYIWDGQIRKMRTTTVEVEVAPGDVRSHTFYETHFGPVINFQGALMPWTPAVAFAIKDANENNFRALEHFLEVNQAETTEEVYQTLARHVGIPWVNTIVADDRGTAFYADMSVVPHHTDAQMLACTTAVGEALKALARLQVLDGTRSSCQPGSDIDAPVPGILGAGKLPKLFRRDYVANSNNSHWIANPAEPLEGYPYVTGAERTPLSPRARLGLLMIREQLAGGGVFDLETLQDTVFNNRQYLGELVRDDLVASCRLSPVLPTTEPDLVDMTGACDALAGWDLHANLDSRGAHLFREFVNGAFSANTFWADRFDHTQPVDTPRKLNALSPEVLAALARAVKRVRATGAPLDAALGDVQRAVRNGDSIPIHGGSEHGIFNYINSPYSASGGGYPDTTYGSSFVITATFDGIGRPRAESILTYSLSTDPTSPWFGDQTWLYSAKRWVPMHMTQADVAANVVVGPYTVSG